MSMSEAAHGATEESLPQGRRTSHQQKRVRSDHPNTKEGMNGLAPSHLPLAKEPCRCPSFMTREGMAAKPGAPGAAGPMLRSSSPWTPAFDVSLES